MQYRRLGIIILSTILLISFGGMAIFWLNDKCPHLSQSDCWLMWGTMMASILGGTLLAETLIARGKSQRKSQVQVQEPSHDKSSLPGWYIWFRPIAWVTLSSLLAGLPLVFQGAFALTINGVAIGFCLAGLIRGITNRLPDFERNNRS